MITVMRLFIAMTLVALLISCSLPPLEPVTRKQLLSTGIYRAYLIEESPEEILNALNIEGEVILQAKEGKYPVFVKILATSDGLKVSSYGR